jgi:hypothetical protein
MPVKFEKPLRASQHCRHYSYNLGAMLDDQGPCCAKGLDLTGPGAANVCMPKGGWPGSCAKREEYTAVERDIWDKWKAASLGRMIQVLEVIPGSADRKDKDYWGKTGTVQCPACGDGKVRWTRAPSNGHLWASCSTPNCFQVMQ